QHRLTGKDYMQLSNYTLSAINPRAQRLYPDALELFYSVPDSQSMPRQPPFAWRTYDLAVRAQVRLQGDGRMWVFPAPSPVDRLVYNEAEHGTPKFKNRRQNFWASERSHEVEQPTPERTMR
ncbi:hypothetical protein LCGC14_1755510, partial [marine sediment metagenome]